MERRLKMKLNKKTIYHVKTKELYDAMMKDAEKQGLKSWQGYKPTELDWWDGYKEHTCIRIDEKGELNYCYDEYYKDNYTDHVHEEYKNTPEVFSCLGGLCVDAPDFNTAYKIFKEHIDRMGALPIQNNVYTVRVEDDNTTVITPDGKMATAKCHPDDEFDIVEGFRVALEKIKELDRKLTSSEKKMLDALVVLNCETISVDCDKDLCCDFKSGGVMYLDIADGDFEWLTVDTYYDPKELLEKYA